MKLKTFFCIYFSLFCVSAVFSADIVLNGKPNAVIVTGEKPAKSAQLAAFEIQWHVKKKTGALLPITVQAPNTGVRIFVGESSPAAAEGLSGASFKNQEYAICVKGNNIIITGKDAADFAKVNYANHATYPDIWSETGTMYAAYDFLEKLGFQWYMPTELGLTYKPSSSLSIADCKIRRTPTISTRNFGHAEFPADLAGDTMQHINRATLPARERELYLRRKRVGGNWRCANHSFYIWYRRFAGKNDLFAKGYSGRPPQLCYSNPKVAEQIAADAAEYFNGKKSWAALTGVGGAARNGKTDTYPAVAMDDRSWCKCADCQKLLLKKATRFNKHSWKFDNTASDYLFSMVNNAAKKLAKTHPDKFISTLAYASNYFPPSFPLEKNIMVWICFMNDAEDTEIFSEWRSKCKENPLGAWLYYCQPTLSSRTRQTRLFPGFTGSRTEKLFRVLEKNGISAIFWEPPILYYSHRSAAFEMVEGQILWQLCWNSKQDGKQLFDKTFDDFFGPAAKPMREFYLNIEEGYNNPANYKNKFRQLTEEISWKNIGTAERMAFLEKKIAEAKKLAAASPYKERVALFDKTVLQYMEQGRKAYLSTAIYRSNSMQQTEACKMTPKVSGDPKTIAWDDLAPLALKGGLKAEPLKEKINASICHDDKYFYIKVSHKCDTSKLLKSKMLWLNDSYEFYFAGSRGEPFNHLAVDANGNSEWVSHADARISNTEIKDTRIKNEILNGCWNLYIAVPMKQAVPGGIQPGKTLYFNLIRGRETKALACWIPTFAGFNEPSRFGEVYLEK